MLRASTRPCGEHLVRLKMRTTRAAAKRAASEDTKVDNMQLDSGRNKRPALANISNAAGHRYGEASAVCKAGHEGKVHVECDSENFVAAQRMAASNNADDIAQCSGDTEPSKAGDSVGIASLERRTQKDLHISSEPLHPHAEQSRSTPASERQGWSASNLYHQIDANSNDPQMCSVYATDIYNHLRQAERDVQLRQLPSIDFMEIRQRDINASMRGILVDWLVEVAEEYKLVPDTLYLTCAYIDRYLSVNVVNRSKLQLLGVSCMLIASKYEEIYAPQVEEFCYITDNTYNRTEVIQMEKAVLNHLKFELSQPTTKSFLRRFIRAAQASLEAPSLQLEFLGNFLAELTLVDYSFVKFLPSMMAASAVLLANLTISPNKNPWSGTLEHYTKYKASDLKDCVLALHALQANTSNCVLPAIREKYRQPKFKSVSSLTPASSAQLSMAFDHAEAPAAPHHS